MRNVINVYSKIGGKSKGHKSLGIYIKSYKTATACGDEKFN